MKIFQSKAYGRSVALFLFVLLLLLSPTHVVRARQVVLSWQAENAPDAQGVFSLSLSADLPTTVTDVSLVITFDENQVDFLDYEPLLSGINISMDNSEAGMLSFKAADGQINSGTVALLALRFKMKGSGSVEIMLARSRFSSENGDQVPATMMLSHYVDYTPATPLSQETTLAENSTASEKDVLNASSPEQTDSSVGNTHLDASETIEKLSKEDIGINKKSDSSLGLKLALLIGSLVLGTLIFLILRLSRKKQARNKRHNQRRSRR